MGLQKSRGGGVSGRALKAIRKLVLRCGVERSYSIVVSNHWDPGFSLTSSGRGRPSVWRDSVASLKIQPHLRYAAVSSSLRRTKGVLCRRGPETRLVVGS